MCLLKRVGVGLSAPFHLRQDVIAGTVNDAKDGFRLFCGKALAERAHHRYAAADTGFEAQLLAARAGRRPDLITVTRQHRLVRSDDGFTLFECAQEIISERLQLGCFLKAQCFDDDLNRRVVDDFFGARRKQRRPPGKPFLGLGIAGVNFLNL